MALLIHTKHSVVLLQNITHEYNISNTIDNKLKEQ